MKNLALILIGLQSLAFAIPQSTNNQASTKPGIKYTFYMNVNHFPTRINHGCSSQSFATQLTNDITADPQNIQLSGYYAINYAYGSYDVVNYQTLGQYTLYPLAAGSIQFGKWGDNKIKINNHDYDLYGIVFKIPDAITPEVAASCTNEQSNWGACGMLGLLITENDTSSKACVVTSIPIPSR